MAKRIQPKLHNDRPYLDTMAYFYAAKEAAESLLRNLWLANERNEAGYIDAHDIHLSEAAVEATVLLDYLALHAGTDGPEYYLDRALARNKDFAPQRDHALQLLAVMATSTPAKRRAA